MVKGPKPQDVVCQEISTTTSCINGNNYQPKFST